MNLSLVLTWVVALHGSHPVSPDAMVVHVRDLDLRSEAGSALALQRIRVAAKAFCAERTGEGLDVTDLNCRSDMTRRAVAKLGSAEVRALYLDSLADAALAER